MCYETCQGYIRGAASAMTALARAACTDLLSEQFGLEWVKKPCVSSVNKKEMIRAEQAHFCWDSLKAVHRNTSNAWRGI